MSGHGADIDFVSPFPRVTVNTFTPFRGPHPAHQLIVPDFSRAFVACAVTKDFKIIGL